jgi:hypothetical protein
MTIPQPRPRRRKPLDAGPFAPEIGSFRLHQAAEGKAAKTVRTYTEVVQWFVTMPDGPDSRDDTHDLIDDALAELARRRGAWLGDDITAMTLIDQAGLFLPEMVTNARLNCHPGTRSALARRRTTAACTAASEAVATWRRRQESRLPSATADADQRLKTLSSSSPRASVHLSVEASWMPCHCDSLLTETTGAVTTGWLRSHARARPAGETP